MAKAPLWLKPHVKVRHWSLRVYGPAVHGYTNTVWSRVRMSQVVLNQHGPACEGVITRLLPGRECGVKLLAGAPEGPSPSSRPFTRTFATIHALIDSLYYYFMSGGRAAAKYFMSRSMQIPVRKGHNLSTSSYNNNTSIEVNADT